MCSLRSLGSARTRARDRVGHRAPVLDLDEGLGARADDGEVRAALVAQLEVVQVRAGVDRAQHAVHVERVCGALEVEALREHHLEDLAVADRVLADSNQLGVLVLRDARGVRGLLELEVEHRGARGDGLREGGLHRVEPRDGGRVGLVDARVRAVHVDRVRDEPHDALEVVDHGEVDGEAQRELGHLELLGGLPRERGLPLVDEVPAHRADEAARERGQSRDRRGAEHLEGLAEHVERGALRRYAHRDLALPGDLAVAHREGRERGDPHEGVARPAAVELGGLEDEGARAPLGEAAVEAHGGDVVGEEAADHRHDASVAREPAEPFEARPGRAPGELGRRRPLPAHGCSPSSAPRSPPASKQLRDPVWHAGPT